MATDLQISFDSFSRICRAKFLPGRAEIRTTMIHSYCSLQFDDNDIQYIYI